MKLFRYPQNYLQQVIGRNKSNATPPINLYQVADNDYDTFVSNSVIVCDVSELIGDDATKANAIFLKASGVASYRVAITNGSGSIADRTIPDTITSIAQQPLSIVVDGIHNDLYEFTDITAQQLTFTFTAKAGETIKIYELMILEKLLDIPTVKVKNTYNRRLKYTNIRRGEQIQESAESELTAVPSSKRSKWQLEYATVFKRKEDYEKLLNIMRHHPNHTCAGEYNFYPDRVHISVFPKRETELPFLTDWILQGNQALFTIAES